MQFRLSQALALGFAAMLPISAVAQGSYPSKPIRIVVPFGPGSATDTIARMLGERAGKIMGTTFVIDNKPGANGLLAAREVVSAPKDGYTIMVSSNSAHAANKYLYKNLGYDPVNDFAPITGLTTNPHVFVVRATCGGRRERDRPQASPRPGSRPSSPCSRRECSSTISETRSFSCSFLV